MQNNLKIEIKDILEHFASRNIQEQIWIHKAQGLIFAPDDFFEWFDDIGLRVDAPQPDYLNDAEWKVVYSFIVYQDKFIREHYDYIEKHISGSLEKLLDYKPWIAFREEAKSTLKKLIDLGW